MSEYPIDLFIISASIIIECCVYINDIVLIKSTMDFGDVSNDGENIYKYEVRK